MAFDFLTVPEELIYVAEQIQGNLEMDGYSVTPEDRSRPDCPYLPTLRAKRGSTTIFVEVSASCPEPPRVREWRAFCASQPGDTRFVIGVPTDGGPSASESTELSQKGIGVHLVSLDFQVTELLSPHDLALGLEPPSLTSYPNKVRKSLGPAWEELRRGQWLEGFDSACIALETDARRYLKAHVKSGRVSFQTSGGKSMKFTERQIEKMTMGQLKDAFAMITRSNHSDSALFRILNRLNQPRILVAHKRQDAAAIRKLRKSVPSLLWEVVRGVEQATK